MIHHTIINLVYYVVITAQDQRGGWSLLNNVAKTCLVHLLPLAVQYGFGRFGTGNENAVYLPIVAKGGAVAERPVNVFEPTISVNGNELVFKKSGFATTNHLINHGADEIPGFRPDVGPPFAQRRVFTIVTQTNPVGIIVETNEIGPPE